MQIIAKYIFGLGAIIAFALLSLAILPAKAEYIDTTPDCDKYAVMYCGSFTKSEILKKYNNGDGKNSASNIKSVYDKFSISESKIKNANFKQGVVYKNGEVKIGSKVVATGAKTYIRTMGVVSTSKMGSAQAALVAVDSNGKFLFAIMTPCGNPISGKPVEPPKPKPQSLTCDNLTVTIVNKEKREVSAKVTGTPKNTTITGYKINFGDGKESSTKTSNTTYTANHTYANYGKYTVTGYV
nr:PKD domain-containing protein [Patescibacteria group bacterium]